MSDTTTEVPRGGWAQARSLADLGALTALWLEGRIWHQPGYADPVRPGEAPGPDPETRDLVPVLAACNRAGFVTSESQPGDEYAGMAQRAFVHGFTDDSALARLRAQCDDSLVFIAGKPGDRWHGHERIRLTGPPELPVGRVARWVETTCGTTGRPLTRRHLRDGWVGYGECHRAAVDALCNAWQVTIIDPEWGRNSILWPALAAFARNSR